VDIDGEPFDVIGIFESFVGFENISVIVPLKSLQEVSAREGRITGVSAVLTEEAKKQGLEEQVCSKIMALQTEDGKPARLIAKPIRREVEEATQMKMTRAMAWLTSVIAIVMGTTSVLNTMIMSVMERIREISILRAIGWRRSRIVKMILGESLLLSFVGALAGVLFAILLMRWLPTLPFATDIITPTISTGVILKGFAMAFLVGLIGAVYPAYRASRLLPIEGLRVE
jgi:putative ABC transport system permease protein